MRRRSWTSTTFPTCGRREPAIGSAIVGTAAPPATSRARWSARRRIDIRRWRRFQADLWAGVVSSVPTMTAGTWEATVSPLSPTSTNGPGHLVGDSTFRHRRRSCSKGHSTIDPTLMLSPPWRMTCCRGSAGCFREPGPRRGWAHRSTSSGFALRPRRRSSRFFRSQQGGREVVALLPVFRWVGVGTR